MRGEKSQAAEFMGLAREFAARWIKDLNNLSQDVKGKKFSQVEWQMIWPNMVNGIHTFTR